MGNRSNPWPLTLLLIGIAFGAPVGVIARDGRWFARHDGGRVQIAPDTSTRERNLVSGGIGLYANEGRVCDRLSTMDTTSMRNGFLTSGDDALEMLAQRYQGRRKPRFNQATAVRATLNGKSSLKLDDARGLFGVSHLFVFCAMLAVAKLPCLSGRREPSRFKPRERKKLADTIPVFEIVASPSPPQRQNSPGNRVCH